MTWDTYRTGSYWLAASKMPPASFSLLLTGIPTSLDWQPRIRSILGRARQAAQSDNQVAKH